MNKKIKLGKYTIHVSIINGVRMVKYSDVIELLKLNGKDVTKNYVEAKFKFKNGDVSAYWFDPKKKEEQKRKDTQCY